LISGCAFGLAWSVVRGRVLDVYAPDGEHYEVAISDNYYQEILHYDIGVFVSDTVEAL
jgi:hypothetical protein